jgi:hypothetical protein
VIKQLEMLPREQFETCTLFSTIDNIDRFSYVFSYLYSLFTIEQLTTTPYCYAQAGTYRIFYDFLYFATYSFTPLIVMVIVGLRTFYNIHQMRRQIAPMNTANTNVHQLRKRDRQLI